MAEHALPGRLEDAFHSPEMGAPFPPAQRTNRWLPSADIDTTGLVSAAGPDDDTPQGDNDSASDSDLLEERALELELKLIRIRIRMRARKMAARTPTRPTTPAAESPQATQPETKITPINNDNKIDNKTENSARAKVISQKEFQIKELT